MHPFIVPVIFGLVVFLYWSFADGPGMGMVLGFFSAIGILLLEPLLALGLGLVLPHHHVVYMTYDIVALQDGQGPQGQFFLGSGSVDSQLKFFFYEKVANNGIEGKSVTSDEATVYQSDSNRPHVDELVDSYGRWNWLAGNFYHHYNIYIPPNSLKSGYTLDLGAGK